MGAGASSLGEFLTRERALKLGHRYGFTVAMFDRLQDNGQITVKQLIDSVKKHADLQGFDRNRDGKLDKTELQGLVEVLKSEADGSEPTTSDPPTNIKTVFTGTMKSEEIGRASCRERV